MTAIDEGAKQRFATVQMLNTFIGVDVTDIEPIAPQDQP